MPVLVLSPHLDDAAFSISPLLVKLRSTCRIIVATPFAASVAQPEGFALACQLDKGLGAGIDYMQLRRHEDADWAEAIGAEVIHGKLKEAPHRGYGSPDELFSGIQTTDTVGPELESWVRALAAELSPELILLPLGIGGHVDHRWLRQVTEAAESNLAPIAYFCDQPYCAKLGLDPLDPALAETRALDALKLTAEEPAVRVAVRATEAYASQIPFQFGTFQKMGSVLAKSWQSAFYLFAKKSAHREIQPIIQSALY